MNEKNYKVYAHINKLNGFVYVGVTKNELDERWMNGYGYIHQHNFRRYLIYYGWINFHHILLADNLSKDEAYKVENELVLYYKELGLSYNNADGGEINTGWHYHHTEDSKRRISESRKGQPGSMKGKHHSHETKIKLAKTNGGKLYIIDNDYSELYTFEDVLNKLSVAKNNFHRRINKHHSIRITSAKTKETHTVDLINV